MIKSDLRAAQHEAVKKLSAYLGQTIYVCFAGTGSSRFLLEDAEKNWDYVEIKLTGVDLDSNLIKVEHAWIEPLYLNGEPRFKTEL